MEHDGESGAIGEARPSARTIRPRFEFGTWPGVPGPNEVRYPLACGARARVVITIDARGCQCGAAHAPSAEEIAGEIWLAMRDLLAGPSGGAVEGGPGNDGA